MPAQVWQGNDFAGSCTECNLCKFNKKYLEYEETKQLVNSCSGGMSITHPLLDSLSLCFLSMICFLFPAPLFSYHCLLLPSSISTCLSLLCPSSVPLTLLPALWLKLSQHAEARLLKPWCNAEWQSRNPKERHHNERWIKLFLFPCSSILVM